MQRMAGNTGVLWPPALNAKSADPPLSGGRRVCTLARDSTCTAVGRRRRPCLHAEGLAVGGFQRLARLAYMAVDVRPVACTVQASDLNQGQAEIQQRLAAVHRADVSPHARLSRN